MLTSLLLPVVLFSCASRTGEQTPEPAPRASLQLVESWPVETPLDQPDIVDAHVAWLEMIGSAQRSLDLAQFYVSPNPDAADRMDAVLEAVEAAAARGVAVRLIADAKFEKTYPEDLARLGGLEGVQVRIYDMKPLTGGVMHAKYFLVDGREGYLGSQNFDWRSLEHIQELGLRFQGAATVGALQAVFEQDWALAGGSEAAVPDAVPPEPMMWRDREVSVRFVASPRSLVHDDVWDLPVLLKAIEEASSTVRLQLLSYAVMGYDKTEWREIDDALRAAGARGVAVQILVSNWQKSRSKQAVVKDLSGAEGVSVRFVNIPEHSDGWVDYSRTVHSKFLVVDGTWSWVGTSNWSRDYFHGSRNVGLVVVGAPLAERLDALHQGLWDSDYAEAVDPEQTYQSPYEVHRAAARAASE